MAKGVKTTEVWVLFSPFTHLVNIYYLHIKIQITIYNTIEVYRNKYFGKFFTKLYFQKNWSATTIFINFLRAPTTFSEDWDAGTALTNARNNFILKCAYKFLSVI